MSTVISNGSPHWNPLGTEDISGRQVPRERLAVPQHLAKIYIWAQKGDLFPNLVAGADRDTIYGASTFTEGSKYFNHATLLANVVNGNGNMQMLQRVLPEDAGPKSNVVVWLDVLPTIVDLYERNPDRSIKLDALGDPTIIGTAQGYKIKFVATHRADDAAQGQFGQATMEAGDQVDVAANVQSQRIPLFEFENYSKGADGNNTAISMWAPTRASMPIMPARLMSEEKAYPYFISIKARDSEIATAKPTKTVFGEMEKMISFKPAAKDPSTGEVLDASKTLIKSYSNTTDPAYAKIYGRLGRFHVYQDNLNELLALFHAAEVPFIDAESDITANPDSIHLFNFVTGVDSGNAPYHSYVFVDSPSTIRFSDYNNLFLRGGSDGTMTDAKFDELVRSELQRYSDPEDELQDLAYHVESVFYDSGFSLETKLEIPNFISRRLDTIAILGTHVVGEAARTAVQEHAVAVALRARLNNYPDSTYFGTPVFRSMIMGCSGIVRNSAYDQRVPATIEIANKFSKFMGAGNGQWSKLYNPEGEPGNTVELLTDINITFVSPSARGRNWSVGLNWIQRGDREELFIPTYKTVYGDDTSVLNSIIVAFAVAQLNKISYRVWRRYVGRTDLSGPQLTERTNNDVRAMTLGKFAERYTIVPQATITDMDELRNFSWTLPILLGADGMKNVLTSYVRAARKADIENLA